MEDSLLTYSEIWRLIHRKDGLEPKAEPFFLHDGKLSELHVSKHWTFHQTTNENRFS